MSQYRLIFDKIFERKYRKLDNSIQIEGDKKLKRLKEAPISIGKPLHFLPSLYELYLQSYRIYYYVKEKDKLIPVLAIEHKDEQRKFLNELTKEKVNEILRQANS